MGRVLASQGELRYLLAVKVGCGLHRLVKFGFVQAVKVCNVESCQVKSSLVALSQGS